MDTRDMQTLFREYLSELEWSGGVTKDDVLEKLAGRDDSLRTMVDQFIAEGTYQDLDTFIGLIPAEAWQSVQGDTWRGPESQYVEDVESNFQQGEVAKDPIGSDQARQSKSSGSGGGREAQEGTNIGTQNAGVWPASGPRPDNPDARAQGMASFGQGERGAEGYEDSGDSEVRTMPPGDSSGRGKPKSNGAQGSIDTDQGQVGEPGSNQGEIDPGISGIEEESGDPTT